MSWVGRWFGWVLVAFCALGLLLAAAPVALAAPGELDTGFATGGVFTGSFQTEPSSPPPREQSAAVDSQGRTVIAVTRVDAQNRRHLDVMRLTRPGALDTSFNPQGATPGIVEVDFSAYVNTIDVYARGVAVVGGDEVVALGWVHDTNANNFTALVRLGSDGSYDTTFGQNHDGRTVDVGNPNYARFPDSLAVDGLGRILVGGSCGNGCGGIVARYTSTGARDSTGFNASDPVHPGVVAIAQGNDVSSLALATDGTGDILAADGSSSRNEAVIARIRPDGTLDATFGSGGPTPGVVESGMGCQACANTGAAFALGVAAGPGGTVYATGQVSDPGGAQPMRLLRLTQGGNPDPAFGSGSPAPGVVAAPSGGRGVSVALDGSACPVIAGWGPRSDPTNVQIVAARFTGAGQLDQAFNPSGQTPGVATFPLGSRALGETVSVGGDGKIVIGGEVDQFGTATIRNAVALRLQGGGCGTQQQPSPTAVTGQATNVSRNAATLGGTVNPNGAQVSDCHFDYGTTANYGSSVPCAQAPGTGASPVPVSATLSGLTPGTTYAYRLVASGPGGTSNGDNQTFTTLPPPQPTTLQIGRASGSGTVPAGATDVHEGATITGANAHAASGTVTFFLYSSPQCSANSLVFWTFGGVSIPPFASGATADSGPVPRGILRQGTYYWTAHYSGDDHNQASDTPCYADVLTVAPPVPTTLVTSQTWLGRNGASITVPWFATGESDEATLSIPLSGPVSVPTGTVSFRLYRQAPSGPQCTPDSLVFPRFIVPNKPLTVIVLPSASSDPVDSELAPGIYYWTATYSGDIAYAPTTSPCGAERLTVRSGIGPSAESSATAVRLRISCPVAVCRYEIKITVPALRLATDARNGGKRKPPAITLAFGTVTVRKHVQKVSLQLTSAGRRFVASHGGRVHVTAVITTRINGRTRVIRTPLTLRLHGR